MAFRICISVSVAIEPNTSAMHLEALVGTAGALRYLVSTPPHFTGLRAVSVLRIVARRERSPPSGTTPITLFVSGFCDTLARSHL